MEIPPIIPRGPGINAALPPKFSSPLPPHVRRPRWKAATALAISALSLVAAGFLATHKYCSPRRSIMALASACQRQDRKTVASLIDGPALADSFRHLAIESYHMHKTNSTALADRLVDPLFDQLANGIVNVTYTPDSMVGILCGESPLEEMRRGMGGSTDQAVDTFTKDASPKVQFYGGAAKVLFRWAEGYLIDEGARKAQVHKSDATPTPDYVLAAEYESSSQYLVKMSNRNSEGPILAFSFVRHGLATWKFTEVRVLPKSSVQPLAARL